MKYGIVPVKNIARLTAAAKTLIGRAEGMPGMGIVDGPTGFGKTLSTTWLMARERGVFVRSLSVSSPSSFLGSILKELDIEPKGSCARMVDAIVQSVARDKRPIFIDEADKLVSYKRLIETTRDIHDLSTAPVILIGEGTLHRKVEMIPRLAGRILEVVEFKALDLDDARKLAEQLCEVRLEDELVKHINETARGSTRLNVVALSKVESIARARAAKSFGLKDWLATKDRLFIGDNSQVR